MREFPIRAGVFSNKDIPTMKSVRPPFVALSLVKCRLTVDLARMICGLQPLQDSEN
jgi:hypothetical protein